MSGMSARFARIKNQDICRTEVLGVKIAAGLGYEQG